MRAESTAAMAQAIECWRIRTASSSRRSAGRSFESRRPRMRCAGSRMTAAATTGPNSDPRPTSSTPATCSAPAAQARFSKLSVQRSFFSRRSLAAAAEMPSFDVGADLDTESAQHLRRRRGGKQEQTTGVCACYMVAQAFSRVRRIELGVDSIAGRGQPMSEFSPVRRKNRYAKAGKERAFNCNDVALTALWFDYFDLK